MMTDDRLKDSSVCEKAALLLLDPEEFTLQQRRELLRHVDECQECSSRKADLRVAEKAIEQATQRFSTRLSREFYQKLHRKAVRKSRSSQLSVFDKTFALLKEYFTPPRIAIASVAAVALLFIVVPYVGRKHGIGPGKRIAETPSEPTQQQRLVAFEKQGLIFSDSEESDEEVIDILQMIENATLTVLNLQEMMVGEELNDRYSASIELSGTFFTASFQAFNAITQPINPFPPVWIDGKKTPTLIAAIFRSVKRENREQLKSLMLEHHSPTPTP